ncbi:MAG: peptide deformylase [Coriobacteriales bacterium]|nr:peptide deformylase [Coriobacteriales bacterium]
MRIITSPDPLLHEVCEPVEIGDKSAKRLAKQMLREMYKDDGVGLAAPQVGVLKRIVVIDTQWPQEDEKGRPMKKKPLVFINPQIVEHSDERVKNLEGCLSVPGISCEIERWSWVKVKCYDENFNEVIREGDGLFGRCMQHELDHLDGITLFERLSPLDRLAKLEEYKAAVERGAKPGEC